MTLKTTMNMDTEKLEQVAGVLREAAEFEIMGRFGKLKKDDIHAKGAGDVVTTADLEAEHRIREGLRGLFPDIPVVAEEEAAQNPDILNLLDGPGPVWAVDPLDGTRNFASGKPCFALIIALIEDGETQAGWIFDPVSNVMAQAAKGRGAWMGSQKLTLAGGLAGGGVRSAAGPLNGSLGQKRRKQWESEAPEAGETGSIVRYGCVGREYIDLALGKLHFAHYGGRLMVWDHAAGVLIHAEAGGYSAFSADGAPYTPLGSHTGADLLLAPDRDRWQGINDRLFAG